MPEVLRCADRITVLRKGRITATLPRADADRNLLVKLLVGEQSDDWSDAGPRRPSSASDGAPALEFVHVSCRTDDGRPGLQEVSLSVQPGEILGVAAVSGNGQEYLGDLILGLRPVAEGSILLGGKDLDSAPPAEVLRQGVACLPEDPLRMGAVGGMTVRENLILGHQVSYWKTGGWSPDKKKLETDAEAALMTAFVQSPPALDARAGNLSGGNLQRMVIARELGRDPGLMVSYYLTRGLDLSNAQAARELVLSHAEGGMAVLFISEDLDELFALSDRLLVLHAGRAAGTFEPAATTPQAVGLLMTGASHG
jgi:simple sugar transport system ATP-binding protein